jgi:hypothetical protein
MLQSCLPNAAVQWVTLCIWDIPGPNLNLHTGYLVVSLWYSSVPSDKYQTVTQTGL